MKTAIWWIRRDLRLKDNQALNAALSSAHSVVPVFVLDPKLINSPNSSAKRLAFLYHGLSDLNEKLQERGSRLIIRKGSPREALHSLIEESGAEKIYAEADFSPYARKRDAEVSKVLPLNLVGSPSVCHPNSVLKESGEAYKVFTPFMRAWKALYQDQTEPLLASPEQINTPAGLAGEQIPNPPIGKSSLFIPPGESAAGKRLQDFIFREQQGIYQYADSRNLLDINGTAQISAYLRFGMISARQCVFAAHQAMQRAPDEKSLHSAETWLNELIWREFFVSILYHYPNVLRQSFREHLRAIPWRNNPGEFTAWCEGRTGYPIVDASMRQLITTGWMHNRGRMIVASFLVKDLLVDWRWGEKFFMQQLIDGDPAANNGGWQWTAGTGTDAAPYFRVFNPILQGKKYDPHGNFIRNWIPELSDVPEMYIHEPWKMPAEIQSHSACIIGQDYPQAMIEHSFARERALEVYSKAKQG